MKHGGNIKQAARQFGLQLSEMIDLSTGISPRAYPIDLSGVTANDLLDLPQDEDALNLTQLMKEAWVVPDSVKIALSPGSGLMISLLPSLCRSHFAENRKTVLCPAPVYSEHIAAWQDAGFDINTYPAETVPTITDDCAAVIAVQPGNPIGNIHPPEDWLSLLDDAASRKVMVVMDEAFIDLDPTASLVPYLGHAGQVVIRSIGKFYGLAGLRLGAAIGHPDDMDKLTRMMGPWPVSSLALRIGAVAISDHAWANDQRQWLATQMQGMISGLAALGINVIGSTDLYCLIKVDHAPALHDHLARCGFWTRVFDDEPSWMRIGLPENDDDRARFLAALDQF